MGQWLVLHKDADDVIHNPEWWYHSHDAAVHYADHYNRQARECGHPFRYFVVHRSELPLYAEDT